VIFDETLREVRAIFPKKKYNIPYFYLHIKLSVDFNDFVLTSKIIF